MFSLPSSLGRCCRAHRPVVIDRDVPLRFPFKYKGADSAFGGVRFAADPALSPMVQSRAGSNRSTPLSIPLCHLSEPCDEHVVHWLVCCGDQCSSVVSSGSKGPIIIFF